LTKAQYFAIVYIELRQKYMDRSEQSHHNNEAQTSDDKPRFVTARRLEGVNDPDAPAYEIDDQPEATLPQLSDEQLSLMGELKPEEWTAENLDKLGLPVGEGVVAVSVDGEKRFINIGPEDYGTIVYPSRVRVTETDSREEQEPGAEKLTRTIVMELIHSADVTEKTANELKGSPESDPQYFHAARDNALAVLNEAVRRALNGESVPVTEELTGAAMVLRQASDQLALDVHGDAVNDRADTVRKSSNNVDDAAREYFEHADPQMESGRAEFISQARTEQIEISSLLHENVTHYVDRIDRDEGQFGDLLSGITTKLAYAQELDEQNAAGLYRDIQELIGLAETSRQARDKLGGDLQSLADHAQRLRELAGQIAQL